jgi:hypothetical protein
VSDIPLRHPNHRPNQQTTPYDPEGERAFAAEWLGHLAAGRVGVCLCRPTAALLEAGFEPSEEVRAIHEANARIFCRGGRLGGG